MSLRPHVLAAMVVLAVAVPAIADETANFIVTLGQDTTAVEKITRGASRVEVWQVGRAPRVLERHFTYEYSHGEISAFSMVVTPPGSSTPTQTVHATFGPDSTRVKTVSGSGPAQDVALPFERGTLVVPTSSPWASYDGLLQRLIREKRDSLRTPMYLVGSNSPAWVRVERHGRDTVSIVNSRPDRYDARVDKQGRILGVLPVAGTQRMAVQRVADLDLAAMSASFTAREQAGAGMGTLSPRDSVVTTVAGASLWVDYGRPGKRGRMIFGDLVPFGEVWRTGANAATQFRTDKALDFGGTVVPPGFYTLWTIPARDGWKLIVNSETGQWGTAHKADKDLCTIDMKVSVLPQVVERFTIMIEPGSEGGALNLDWDTTRASAAFTVRP